MAARRKKIPPDEALKTLQLMLQDCPAGTLQKLRQLCAELRAAGQPNWCLDFTVATLEVFEGGGGEGGVVLHGGVL